MWLRGLYRVQPRPQGTFPWLPKSAYPDKVNHELKVDYMHEGDTFKRNRPWFTPGVLKKVLYGESPLQGPSLLPTIFDVTEVA